MKPLKAKLIIALIWTYGLSLLVSIVGFPILAKVLFFGMLFAIAIVIIILITYAFYQILTGD